MSALAWNADQTQLLGENEESEVRAPTKPGPLYYHVWQAPHTSFKTDIDIFLSKTTYIYTVARDFPLGQSSGALSVSGANSTVRFGGDSNFVNNTATRTMGGGGTSHATVIEAPQVRICPKLFESHVVFKMCSCYISIFYVTYEYLLLRLRWAAHMF